MRGWERLIVACMALLLTGLLMKSMSPPTGRVVGALAALDQSAAAENSLHRDVLSASAGLLPHYDSLASHTAEMDRALGQLRPRLADDEQKQLGGQLAANLARQSQLTERFKTSNALLRNSLAFFAAENVRSRSGGAAPTLRADSDRLSGAVLALSIGATASARQEVDDAISELARRCGTGHCTAEVGKLLAHGRILQKELPVSQGTIKALIRSDAPPSLDRLRGLLARDREAAEAVAGRYRMLLYFCSLVLLLLLVRWGLKIRAHGRAMHRQLALEHVLSRFSTRLIATSSHRIVPEIRTMLGDLADTLGARFAIMQVGQKDPISASPHGEIGTVDWHGVVRLLDNRRTSRQDGISRLVTTLLPAGTPERRLLEGLGAGFLYFVQPQADSAERNLLVLGLPRGEGHWTCSQLKVLRAAVDAVSLVLDHAEVRRERATLRRQLEHAGRMETIGAFASGVAHNFNNLLGAISGHAEMAAVGLDGHVPASIHVDQIRAAAERGQHLISGLLHYGRRRGGRHQVVDLASLLEECRSTAAAALGDGYPIDLSEVADLHVSADPSELLQVFLNLVNNAAQATPEGGIVRIGTRREPTADSDGLVSEAVVITVTDEGIGIAQGLLTRVFDPFFTTRPAGTGLGLSTARDIVREHGGELKLESVAGQGTVASVRLPLIANVRHPSSDMRRLMGTGEGVLYLARSEADRLTGEELLAALGYEPSGYIDPDRALQAWQAEPDRFDALLAADLDFEARAARLFAEVRRLRPSTPRILGLRRTQEHRALTLSDRGVTAILPFPFDARELASTLAQSPA